jgi:hypothetical protein
VKKLLCMTFAMISAAVVFASDAFSIIAPAFAESRYVSLTKGREALGVTYSLETKDGAMSITRVKGNEKVIAECGMDFNFISYSRYVDGAIQLKIERTDSSIVMTGNPSAKKTVSVKKSDVIYSGVILPFLFMGFPFGSRTAIEFVTVNEVVDRFGLSRMQVNQDGPEELTISGKKIATIRLKFSPVGIGSLFYQGFFWYSALTPRVLIRQDMKRGEVLEVEQ